MVYSEYDITQGVRLPHIGGQTRNYLLDRKMPGTTLGKTNMKKGPDGAHILTSKAASRAST